MIFHNEAFYRFQYLIGQISLADYKDAMLLEESMRGINQDLQAIGETLMHTFKAGDKVRLKGSPYRGTVEPMTQGWSYVRFRTDAGIQITVSDSCLLERVIDPQPGDIYEDNKGNEWVIIKQRGWSHHPEDMLAARLVSYAEGYLHSTLALNKPENIEKWGDMYGVRLVRRREG
jgi:hypothetical protein